MNERANQVPTIEIEGEKYLVGEGSFSNSEDYVAFSVVSNPRNLVINGVYKTQFGYAAAVGKMNVLYDLIPIN